MQLDRRHAPASITGARSPGAEPADVASGPIARADERAWPPSSADRAAGLRWADRHPTIQVVTSVAPRGAADDASGVDLVSALSVAARTVRPEGIRRLDLRLPVGHPAIDALVEGGWLWGRVGDDAVLSWPIAYPWNQPAAGDPDPPGTDVVLRLPPWLPPRAARSIRRLRRSHPSQLPEQARIALAEVRASVRTRTLYRGARPLPHPDAPADSFPFAVTRYRTIDRALGLVPGDLRRTRFVDIGSGDGRVLAEAHRAGFAHLLGREVDGALATTARRRLGARAAIEVGDARRAELPDDTGVVFLNNPFELEGLSRLADRIAASLDRRTRPLLVIYINPPGLDPLRAAGLVLVHAEPQFSVLATPDPRGAPPRSEPT